MNNDSVNKTQDFIELAVDESPVYQVTDGDPSSLVVVVCDHASPRIPRSLENLGLAPHRLTEHIAYDIGVADVARNMAKLLRAPVVTTGYSRLVIDPNRHLGTDSSIPEISDGVVIPGNQNLTGEDIRQRIDRFFWPYHNAVTAELEKVVKRGHLPILVSLHSFTPVFNGETRPWEIGVLWNQDHRMAKPLIARLRAIDGLCVGDNQPYHARDPLGYTMDVHAESNSYPHVLLEIRQDQIDHQQGVKHWSKLLYDVLGELLASEVDSIESVL